jgi:nucleoside phosphorylase
VAGPRFLGQARGGAVGDVYVSTAMRNHDRRIELPVFDTYGIWEVASPPAPKLIEARAQMRTPAKIQADSREGGCLLCPVLADFHCRRRWA